jgi:hypothetical protein
MVIIAISPDLKQGRVMRALRMDGIPTAASDTLDAYRKLRGNLTMMTQVYDWACRDFFTLASRQGESFIPAEKGRDAGFGLLNTLFKTGMLKIQRGDPELEKLVYEICTLATDADKKNITTQDDLIDALRYAVMSVNWNTEDILNTTEVGAELDAERKPKVELTEPQKRRQYYMGEARDTDDIQEEFDFWNELSGASSNEF